MVPSRGWAGWQVMGQGLFWSRCQGWLFCGAGTTNRRAPGKGASLGVGRWGFFVFLSCLNQGKQNRGRWEGWVCETVPREMAGLGLCPPCLPQPAVPPSPCHWNGPTRDSLVSPWLGRSWGPVLPKGGWHRDGVAPKPGPGAEEAPLGQRLPVPTVPLTPGPGEYFPPDAAEFLWCDSAAEGPCSVPPRPDRAPIVAAIFSSPVGAGGRGGVGGHPQPSESSPCLLWSRGCPQSPARAGSALGSPWMCAGSNAIKAALCPSSSRSELPPSPGCGSRGLFWDIQGSRSPGGRHPLALGQPGCVQ